MRSFKKKKIYYGLIVGLILVAVIILAWPAKKIYNNNPAAQTKPSTVDSAAQTPTFDKNLYPTDESKSLWVVVNKGRVLPSNYTPANLAVPNVPLRQGVASPEMHVRADTAAAIEKMFAAAKSDGIDLKLESGYRSYAEQTSVYSGYVSASGQAQADTFSARPGHSEHQTGLAADIEPIDRTCEVEQCFENTPAGKWLAANAHKFGFIIRYQKGTQNLTGYEYEPWHVRFVGIDLAQQIYAASQTLEQFFGLPAYTDYPTQSLTLKE
jgi:D-alanyl-D-alanine carboxypeptidase